MTMTATTLDRPDSRFSRPTRRVGYGATVLIDIALIYFVNNVLEWGWFPFLTDDFEMVVPLISFSLAMNGAVNLAYMALDPTWFKTICEAVLGFIAVLVIIRLFVVFPFEFESDFWTTTTRVLLIFIGSAVTIGVLTETVQFITGKRDTP